MSDNPWFIYKRESGRFRCAPANWQGWTVFIGGIVLTIFLGSHLMLATAGYPFIVRFMALSIVILLGVGAICFIALRKGRPSR